LGSSLPRAASGSAALWIAREPILATPSSVARQFALTERREPLRALLDGAPDGLWYSREVAGHEGPALFRHACRMNLEGIVAEWADSRYVSGRFHWWRKIKCPEYRR
jgi:ATP-dependent DNA ligase